MILTKKVRLILTDEESKLYQSAGVARWAYNFTSHKLSFWWEIYK